MMVFSPEFLRVTMPDLLAGVPGEAKEDPGCDVDQQVGDHREPVPDRGQERPGVLIIWSLSFSSKRRNEEHLLVRSVMRARWDICTAAQPNWNITMKNG